jgi:hypothetical protein
MHMFNLLCVIRVIYRALTRQLSVFSTAGSKFVSIVRRARMVSTGDNGIRLVWASEE